MGSERLDAHWMRLPEELSRYLAVRANHGQFSASFDGILVDYSVLSCIESSVCGWMKDVDGFDGCRTGLFKAENQVDPVMKVVSNPAGFKGLSVDLDKEAGFSLAPGRKLDIIDCVSYKGIIII